MRISGYGLYRYALPLTEPSRIGGVDLDRREGVLLRLVGDGGAEGWGEASPLPGFSRESVEEVAGELDDPCSLAVGRGPELWTEPGASPGRELDETRLSPAARFAFELAVWNLLARARGTNLPGVISERPAARVRVNALLAGPPEWVLGEARRLREGGYGAFKLKVGARSVGEDADLVRALVDVLEGATLRLDANRAWSFEEAAEFARRVEGARFEYVEEPLSEPGRLPDLVRKTGLPVALDESLAGMEPGELKLHRYARAVVLKPTMIGGLSRALRFAGEASKPGMAPVVSSAYETGIGTAALVALAAGIGADAPAGLDTYRRLAGDVVSPRLELPAPEVDVRESCAPRTVVYGRLQEIKVRL